MVRTRRHRLRHCCCARTARPAISSRRQGLAARVQDGARSSRAGGEGREEARKVRGNGSKNVRNVNFALQGGGAHGAFVWGVLDLVLEDGRLAIEVISATSAGAMNAVALASGMAQGGAEAARQSLHDFWYEVSRMDLVYDLFSPLNQWIQALKLPPEYHPVHAFVHTLTHTVPPNLLNPFHFNPLRSLLQRVVDFDRLNSSADAPQ